MAELLINATRKDVEAFFQDLYHGTDAVVDDSDIDNVMNAIDGQRSWRKGLPIDEQLALSSVPVLSTPTQLTQDNAPAGVTVVNEGDKDRGNHGDPQNAINQ